MKRFLTALGLVFASFASAADHYGVVRFGGLPLPGATVSAIGPNGGKAGAVSAPDGTYILRDLTDGRWTVRVQMQCFELAERELTVEAGAPAAEWELKLLPVTEIATRRVVAEPQPPPPANGAQTAAAKPAPPKPVENAQPKRSDEETAELNDRAADGLLVNGSVNNGASTPFSINPAFGNFRKGPGALYNGSIGFTAGNSFWDARPYSLTGQDTAKPDYNRFTGMLAFGGPLRIPHLLRNGPNLMINYQWTRNRTAATQSGLVPTEAQRRGDLGPDGFVPIGQISPQAASLLKLYPLPNFTGGTRYNYQVAVTGATHQDSLQARANKSLGRRDQLFGGINFQSTRGDNTNMFGFLDVNDSTGLNVNANWRHSLTPRLAVTLGAEFSRLISRVTPYFSNLRNVSGEAGIQGNAQDPVNWGPPSLTFASGIARLSDENPSLGRNQTTAVSASGFWGRGRHNLSFGTDIRRQQFNLLGQQDPRGGFAFTGFAGLSDFAAFLTGVPDTATVAFGNADKYFRAWFNDAFFTDDWRVNPGFTLNAGVRWEYGSPITERYGRLVNLDLAPGFTAAAPVLSATPNGAVTGRAYAPSLVEPDVLGIQPRVGFSWRPLLASSMVVRGGYGVYRNTSVYLPFSTQMAQQPPLSKTISVENSASAPLTLANGFNAQPLATPNTLTKSEKEQGCQSSVRRLILRNTIQLNWQQNTKEGWSLPLNFSAGLTSNVPIAHSLYWRPRAKVFLKPNC